MTPGEAKAARVSAGLARAGAATGAGTALTGSILRKSGADETTNPPTPGVETAYACTLLLTEYSARDRDGTNITARDVKALIAPDAATDPRNGDRLSVGGKTYSLVAVTAIQPGGTVLVWEAQCRSANE